MAAVKTTTRNQKHKYIKRKDRFKNDLDLGTPQVPLSKQKYQQRHELLRDWEAAS